MKVSQERREFMDSHIIDVKGGLYLPVAPRVVIFRQEHPDHGVCSEVVQVGDDPHVRVQIVSPDGRVLAVAHKRVRYDSKGPAGQYPVETAETGALGRALNMIGIGTLYGDLEEGDQIADAPVKRPGKASSKKPKPKPEPEPEPEPNKPEAPLDRGSGLSLEAAQMLDEICDALARGDIDTVKKVGAQGARHLKGDEYTTVRAEALAAYRALQEADE